MKVITETKTKIRKPRPCANIIASKIQCKRTHALCPLNGKNSKGSAYICDEFKEALGGN